MPQMSPMNWLIISILFLSFLSMMFTLMQKKTTNNTKTSSINNMNLKWKW